MLKELLTQIETIYMSSLPNDEKYAAVSILWEKYYQLKKKYQIESDQEYSLNLLVENECYKVNQAPSMQEPNQDFVKQSLLHLTTQIKNGGGISEEEVRSIIDYVVYHTRKQLSILGISIDTCSMNGFCELAQSLSLRPFEGIGLKVTKNEAENDFLYSLHHCYGTVAFPIVTADIVESRTYLIDTTYRQFFTSNRCHKGMYYTTNKESGLAGYPDPGYFVNDLEFAKTLLKDGYIELTKETASLYGKPFTLSSDNSNKIATIDYYQAILNSTKDYYLSEEQLEGLNVSFPPYDFFKGYK